MNINVCILKVYFLYYTFLNLFLLIFSEKKLLKDLKLNITFYFKIIFIKSNINFYYEKIIFYKILKENPYIWFNLLIFYVLYLENFEEILNHVDKV